MTHRPFLGSDDPRGRVGEPQHETPRFLRYLVTCGALLAMWGFFGGSILSLAVIMFLWAVAVTIDVWNVYRHRPSDVEVRREMDRMKRHTGPGAPGSTSA